MSEGRIIETGGKLILPSKENILTINVNGGLRVSINRGGVENTAVLDGIAKDMFTAGMELGFLGKLFKCEKQEINGKVFLCRESIPAQGGKVEISGLVKQKPTIRLLVREGNKDGLFTLLNTFQCGSIASYLTRHLPSSTSEKASLPLVKDGMNYVIEIVPVEKDLISLSLVSGKGYTISFRIAGLGIDQFTTALDLFKFGALKEARKIEGIGGYLVVKPSSQRYVRIRFGMVSQREREMVSVPLIYAVAMINFLRRLS
ncbi:hypothetical protein [Desulfurobacterium crinifex]